MSFWTLARMFRANRPTIQAAALRPLPLTTTNRERLYRASLLGIGGAYGFRNVDVLESGDDADDALFHGAIPLLQDAPSLYDFPANRFVAHWAAADAADFGRADLSSVGGGPERHSRLPTIQVELDGVALNLLVDTRSPHAVTLHPQAVRRLGLWDSWSGGYERAPNFDLADERGETVRVRRARSLRFMDWTLDGAIVGVIDPSARDRAPAGMDGAIGTDVLARFAIGFEPEGQRIRARASDRLVRPFRHDRSGVQIALRDGLYRVVRVDAGTTGEVAGVRVGDEAVGMNAIGAAAFEWAGSDPEGRSVELALRRGAETATIAIPLEDRL